LPPLHPELAEQLKAEREILEHPKMRELLAQERQLFEQMRAKGMLPRGDAATETSSTPAPPPKPRRGPVRGTTGLSSADKKHFKELERLIREGMSRHAAALQTGCALHECALTQRFPGASTSRSRTS
jgi:hypothetical protein